MDAKLLQHLDEARHMAGIPFVINSAYRCDPQPSTPYRVYAGGIIPVAYRFPDEDTFSEFYPEESM